MTLLDSENIYLRNRLLNETEISGKKLILESKVRNLSVVLTTDCNIRCIMCGLPENHWELPERTLNEIIALFPYLEEITWIGGEIFLYPHIKELLEKGSSFPHLKQVSLTNGLLLNEKWAEFSARRNISFLFSIDGFTKDVYEKIRKGGSFDTLQKNLKVYRQSRSRTSSHPHLVMLMTVMRSNCHQLELCIEFAREYGFSHILFQPVTWPIMKEEAIFAEDSDTQAKEIIRKSLPAVYEKGRLYGIRIENRLPVQLGNMSKTTKTPFEADGMPCHLPWIQMLINGNGSVGSCCLGGESVGNVNNQSLAEIWNGQKMIDFRKSFIERRYNKFCNASCIDGIIEEEYLRKDCL